MWLYHTENLWGEGSDLEVKLADFLSRIVHLYSELPESLKDLKIFTAAKQISNNYAKAEFILRKMIQIEKQAQEEKKLTIYRATNGYQEKYDSLRDKKVDFLVCLFHIHYFQEAL